MKTRGYAYKYDDVVPNFTGFHINTNKTGDPYEIPWEHEDTLKRLWHLRQWQARYNPVKQPLKPDQYLDNPDEYPAPRKAKLPSIFPIARLFPTKFRPFPGRIATISEMDKAWQKLMVEVERRWNLENPADQISIVRYQETTRQPQGSIYNLHGMRVRGLSDLRRGGMPLDLLSKFVAGHASLMMTLYYMEFDPAFINDQLSQAAVSARAKEIDDFIVGFKKMSYDQARQKSVAINNNAIAAATESPSKIEFVNVDIGLCPFDGTRCSDGGAELRADNRRTGTFGVFGAVAPRNCIMCRHFVSGPPWIPQLELFGTKLCAQRQDLARQENEINELAGLIKEQRSAGEITLQEERSRLADRQVALVAIKDEQEKLETSIYNVEVLISASVELLEKHRGQEGEKMLELVGSDRRSIVGYVEVPEFTRSLALSRAAVIHPVLGDDRIKAMRDQRLDLIMHNSGQTPLGLRTDITDRQREYARDLLSQFLLANLRANQIEDLGSGRESLDKRISSQVKDMINHALADGVVVGGNKISGPSAKRLISERVI
ncbi:VPA1269 family protein [Rhizobium johnstonii]|uniref:VPA1269 family protein n=1 Tax=Rhizobium johnstonii TaxID=3019933 RepID=UPI003F997771